MGIKIASRLFTRYPGLLILTILFTGCFQTKQTVWINPEGSGKMAIDALMPVMTLFEKETTVDSMKKQMQKDVKSLIGESSGVDAWSGVSYELTDEGKVHFKGTAYFPDISKVKIKNITQGNISFLPDGKGGRVLLVKEEVKNRPDAAPKKLTEEEIREKIKTEKIKFQQAKPMLSAFLADFKTEALFFLPGKVVSSVNLKPRSGGAYGFSIEGKQIIDTLTALASDDNWWRQQVASSVNILKDGPFGEDMNEKLLGEKGPIKAVVAAPMAPLFDYNSEVNAAEKETVQLKNKLGISSGETASVMKKDTGTDAGTMWKPDLKGVSIPDVNAHGTINGQKFQCEKAVLQGNILHLRQGKDFFADLELVIFFFLEENETLEKKTFEVAANKNFGNPHIHMKWKSKDEDFSPKTEIFMNGYSMRIEFGAGTEGILPGKIYLCLPDEEKSAVAGKFEAEIK